MKKYLSTKDNKYANIKLYYSEQSKRYRKLLSNPKNIILDNKVII